MESKKKIPLTYIINHKNQNKLNKYPSIDKYNIMQKENKSQNVIQVKKFIY